MSRSKHRSKGKTYEYWSNRPGNSHGAPPGKISKKITKRKERAKQLLELKDLKFDSSKYVTIKAFKKG